MVTNSQPFDGTTYFYYNRKWQMVESRDGSENLDSQVIYGTRYVDEVVRFEKNGQGTMFAFQDANWNVTSTANYAGVPLDRIHTTPYGQPTFDTETINGDYDGDGDIDSTDDSNFDTCDLASDPPTGACRVFDFDNDGDVDSADNTTFDALYPGSTEIYRQPSRRTSANAFPFAHQGLMLDPETQTYQNRHRQYNPWQQRFMQRDPTGFIDGLNLYTYLRASPVKYVDPTGLGCRVFWNGCYQTKQRTAGCTRYCDFTCRTETHRSTVATSWCGTATCAQLEERGLLPPRGSVPRPTWQNRNWTPCICGWPGPPACQRAGDGKQQLFCDGSLGNLDLDCSSSSCEQTCDTVYEYIGLGCNNLPPGTPAIIKWLCQIISFTDDIVCYDTCNSLCD